MSKIIKFIKAPTIGPKEEKIIVAISTLISILFLLLIEAILEPNLLAKLNFSSGPVLPGRHRFNSMGSRTIVKKKARSTPSPDMNAKTFMGSKFEVASTEIPAAVVNVVRKIAKPTFSYARLRASLCSWPSRLKLKYALITCMQSAIPTANISSTVRAIMVDIVRPIQTVIPQHHATLMAMVTIGQANALPERNNIHNKKEKISTIRVPRSAIWLSTPCICPIIDGVPTA